MDAGVAVINAGAAVTTTAWQALITNCFGVRCSQGGCVLQEEASPGAGRLLWRAPSARMLVHYCRGRFSASHWVRAYMARARACAGGGLGSRARQLVAHPSCAREDCSEERCDVYQLCATSMAVLALRARISRAVATCLSSLAFLVSYSR